jgi:hypothetical protein
MSAAQYRGGPLARRKPRAGRAGGFDTLGFMAARRRARVRGPWVREGSRIGPLGPFRGRLGLHWVIASVALAAVVLLAGLVVLSRIGGL